MRPLKVVKVKLEKGYSVSRYLAELPPLWVALKPWLARFLPAPAGEQPADHVAEKAHSDNHHEHDAIVRKAHKFMWFNLGDANSVFVLKIVTGVVGSAIALVFVILVAYLDVLQGRLTQRDADFAEQRRLKEGQAAEQRRLEEKRKSDERVAEANRIAEEARKETTELRTRMAGRTITPEQEKTLLSILRPLSATPINVTYATSDDEQRRYAERIIRVLQMAGYQLDIEPVSVLSATPPAIGLQIFVRSNPPQPLNAPLLQEAFRRAEIPTQWLAGDFPMEQFDRIGIIVGSKPSL